MTTRSENIIEATDPKDRPTEAVAQLRDISEWLRAEGHRDLAGDADALADEVDFRLVRED